VMLAAGVFGRPSFVAQPARAKPKTTASVLPATSSTPDRRPLRRRFIPDISARSPLVKSIIPYGNESTAYFL
jgi:hypothetical protein